MDKGARFRERVVPGPRTVSDLGRALDEMVAALTALLTNLGEASKFNLETAVRAALLAGVGGQLVIHVPRKVGERLEVDWVSPAKPSSGDNGR